MSFRTWLANKISPKNERVSSRSGTGFSDDDRDASAQVRAMKAMLRQRQQALELQMQIRQMEDMEAQLYGDDEDDEGADAPEDYAIKKFTDIVAKRMEAGTPGESKTLTDDDIRAWIGKQPAFKITKAKAMTDEELIPIIMQSTGVDRDAATRGASILKAEF